MSLAQQYSDAIFPPRIFVLGKELLPLSIGHALLLHSVRSPFAEPWKPVESGSGDLVLAIYICSRPWQIARIGVRSRKTKWILKWWARKLRKPKYEELVAKAQEQFFSYINQSWEGPSVWENVEKNRKNGAAAPLLASLKVTLCCRFNRTESEALSTWLRTALFDCAANGELDDQIQWLTEDELEFIEKCNVQARN